MTDKLLTLKEAAESLGLPEEEIRRLVKKGDIPAYQIGGMYLRFKEEQILSLKPIYSKKISAISIKKEQGDSPGEEPRIAKIKDFFYFSNFYIISLAIIIFLSYIIYRSIK